MTLQIQGFDTRRAKVVHYDPYKYKVLIPEGLKLYIMTLQIQGFDTRRAKVVHYDPF